MAGSVNYHLASSLVRTHIVSESCNPDTVICTHVIA